MPVTSSTLLTPISVVVATRNRSLHIAGTIKAVLQTRNAPLEIIVVDQSDPAPAAILRETLAFIASQYCVTLSVEDESQPAAQPGRLRYVACNGRGASLGRNIGARFARHNIVLFVDDDILPDPGWTDAMTAEYARDENVVGVYGRILPYDPKASSADDGNRTGAEVTRAGMERKCYTRPALPWYLGSGGNMSFRRDALLACGGFDEVLTIGGPFRAFEDIDIGYRLLLRGLGNVVYCPQSLVYHDSVKTFEEQLRTESGYGISVGAAAIKYARCGDPFAPRIFLTWLWHMAVRRSVAGVIKWRNRAVVRLALLQFWYPWVGIAKAWRWPLDTKSWIYLPLARSLGK